MHASLRTTNTDLFRSTESKATVSQFLNLFCVEMYNPSLIICNFVRQSASYQQTPDLTKLSPNYE